MISTGTSSDTKQDLSQRDMCNTKVLILMKFSLLWHHGWHVHHLDVKSVFLNSEVAQEVYVEQPRGFMLKIKENMFFRLHKALYGLHQVPRAWNCSP
jgi:hypothetical protein